MGEGRRRLAYQPALDGFRALAVLAVLLYHNGTSIFPGGFLGVDAFFVLSGYLITTLLVLEWQADRGIRLRAFWGRRARRLLPALLVTLVLVGVYAYLAVPADELSRIRGDGIATLLYVQNWQLVFTHQSYFEQFVSPSPLRHAWSLAIEEQWYLVWPMVIAGLLAVTRGRLARLIPIVAGLALASATLMFVLYQRDGDPSRVYYGTDTRSQTLLIGAVLALVLLWRGAPQRRWSRGLVEGAGILAAVYVVVLFVRLDDTSAWAYRGGLSLAAVAFGMVILAAVQPSGLVLRRVLSWEPLRLLGLISYGVYLYHWPIFLWLTPSRTGLEGTTLLLVRFGITLVAATASYVFVEMPVRRLEMPRVAWLVAAPAAGVMVVVVLVVGTLGATSNPSLVTRALSDDDTEELGDVEGEVPTLAEPFGPAPPGMVSVLTTGDSQAFTLAGTLGGPNEPLFGLGIWGQGATTLGCGTVGGEQHIGSRRGENLHCQRVPAIYQQGVDDIDPDVVLYLAGAWDVFDRELDGRMLRVGTPEYEHAIVAALDGYRELLTRRGARFVILTTPCFDQVERFENDGVATRNDTERIGWLNSVWRRYAKDRSNTTSLIDFHGFVCDRQGVRPELARIPLRSDGVHFTYQGGNRVWEWLVPRIKDIAARYPRDGATS